MKTVFVDTSGFYAVLDRTDPFHNAAKDAFQRAEQQKWRLVTTSILPGECDRIRQRGSFVEVIVTSAEHRRERALPRLITVAVTLIVP